MTDIYSERLNMYKREKEEKRVRSLPLQKPNTTNLGNVGTGGQDIQIMAGQPKDPNSQPDIPDGRLKTVMGKFGKRDPNFQAGMETFITALETMKKEIEGLGLPDSIKESRVKALIEEFANSSRGQQAMPSPQQLQQPQVPNGALEGGLDGTV